EDVAACLRNIVDYEWEPYLRDKLESREGGEPLEGLNRGGYRLTYRPWRSGFSQSYDALYNQFDLRFSLGVTVGDDGTLKEVVWGSPAFEAGLTVGSRIHEVAGEAYSAALLSRSIEQGAETGGVQLRVATRSYHREV